MNTCEVCQYSLEISKYSQQKLNNITSYSEPGEFIKLFTAKKKKQSTDPSVSLELLFDKKALTDKMVSMDINAETKKMIVDKFTEYQNGVKPNKFCWECTNCAQTYILNPGVIASISYKKTSKQIVIENIDDIIDDPTYFRDNDIVCPNSSCKREKKAAILYRPNPAEYGSVYICVDCKTQF